MKAFVIKFDNDYYWCGYNNSDKQLRKAVLYKSVKMAEETAKDCMDRIEYIRPYVNKIESYKIIEVTIAEGDLEQENKKLCQHVIELNTDNNRLIKENNEINLRLLRSDTYRLSFINARLSDENKKLKKEVNELRQKLKDIRKLTKESAK